MSRILVLFLCAVLPASAQLSQGNWKTDLSKKSINLSELRSGGPPKDGIRAIDRPEFTAVNEAAKWVGAREPVLVVTLGGEARAYPLQILVWNELVNDRIGDRPILVSYCPLCNTAITFDRRVDGVVHDFGVSGMLRHSDMVMYDRQTDSLWQQATGAAIVGAATGKQLDVISSQVVSFDDFRESFPNGRILSRPTRGMHYGSTPYAGYEFSGRLRAPVDLKRALPVRPTEQVVAVTMEGKTKAFTFDNLRRTGVAESKIKKKRFVVFHDPGTVSVNDARRISGSRQVGSVGVFSPELDGKRLKFRRKKGKILDKETGSTWNLFGVATDGPMAGKRLEPVDHLVYYAFALMAFHPRAQIVGVAARSSTAGEPSQGLGGGSRTPAGSGAGPAAPGPF